MKIELGRLLDLLGRETEYNKDKAVFGKNEIIKHSVWLLVIEAINKNIPPKKRKAYIHDRINREIELWIKDND